MMVKDSNANNVVQSSLESERNFVLDKKKRSLEKNDTWYLLDSHWYQAWDTFTKSGQSNLNPGPIDNGNLYNPGSKTLKENLTEHVHYELVPKEAWKVLSESYDVKDGSTFPRGVIESGVFVKQLTVEVYRLNLRLKRADHLERDPITLDCSQTEILGNVLKLAAERLEVPPTTSTRICVQHDDINCEELTPNDMSLGNIGVKKDQLLILDYRKDGKYFLNAQEKAKPTANNGQYALRNSATYNGYASSSRQVAKGLCGLSNLGNTCFMNSALQCLTHVLPLAQYFLDDPVWKKEVNKSNPLGMGGQIAEAFADLVHHMYSGTCSTFSPRTFKQVLGRFAPQFSGFQQQDSQEFMAFLLDGLHEDLNRVKKKPYVEVKEAEGRSDQEVAKEAWQNYKLRNDSVIVDKFHGLLKSTLVCPGKECGKVSITFDPFCYLSLPLPQERERTLSVMWMPYSTAREPKKHLVNVPRNGNACDVVKAIEKLEEVDKCFKVILVEIYQSKVHRILRATDSISSIMDADILYAFELPKYAEPSSSRVTVPIFVANRTTKDYSEFAYSCFGTPFIAEVTVDKDGELTYADLVKAVEYPLKRFVLPEDEKDKEWYREGPTKDGNDVDSGVEENGNFSEPMDVDNGTSTSSESSSSPKAGDSAPPYYQLRISNVHYSKAGDACEPGWSMPAEQLEETLYLAIDWHPSARIHFYNSNIPPPTAPSVPYATRFSGSGGNGSRRISLDECMQLFTSMERLGHGDEWYCPRCKKHQQANKKFDLWSLPEVLIIHLKRFSFNRYFRDKISCSVDFPLESLDMSPWIKINAVTKPLIYDLVAVSNHFGGLGGGHYTAHARMGEKWYNFDDSSVQPAESASIKASAAYVLVYERRQIITREPNLEPEDD